MSGEAEVLEAVQAGCAAGAGSGRPEAVLREHVQPALEAALSSRGLRSSSRDEFHLAVPSELEAAVLDAPLASSGRADAIYNRFVIEFEPPGSLRPSVAHSATRHAVSQVQQYLRGLSENARLPLNRLAGCAFDGDWIVYVAFDAGQWHVARPRPVDLDSLNGMLETLQSLASGRGLTADNLYEDFGPSSDVAMSIVPLLTEVFSADRVPSRAAAFFEQWKLDLGNASGLPSSMDIPDWLELCQALGVPPDDAKRPQVLFALQTYFGIVAKLISLVVLEGAMGAPLLYRLTESEDIWAAFESLESGHLTSSIGALNAVEPGIFSWYLAARSEELGKALKSAAGVASEYSAEVVEITPVAARDVMKHLFQRLLPRSLRHRLGEYYTPDWLAEFVLDDVGYAGDPDHRVLDPACGSGTFLVLAIARIRKWVEDHADDSQPDDLLTKILDAITGFDLSPLAVMAARTNYLIAIRDLLRGGVTVEIPVYLCDSILSPVEYGDLFTGGLGKVLELRTSVERFLVPAEVTQDQDLMAALADTLQSHVDDRRSSTDFVASLKEKGVPVSDEGAYEKLFEQVSALAAVDVDGIWADIIRNSFAAAMQQPVDFVVGNPPWVYWNTLPLPYRDEIKRIMVDVYGLAAGTESTMRRLGSAKKDLSALFVYVALDRYVKQGGRLGFVITQTLFQTIASDEFRRWRLPTGETFRIEKVDDWVRVRPFASAANKTATFVATRGDRTEYPVRYRVRTPAGRFDRDSASLSEVLEKTTVREAWARPSDPKRPESYWVISDVQTEKEWVPRPSYQARLGISTALESVYRVRVLEETERDTVLVENIRDRARIPVESVEREVELDLLYPYLTGATISRWRAWSTGIYVVPHTESTGMAPLLEHDLKTDYPLTYEYLSHFRDQLEERSLHKRWGKQNPFYSLYNVGPYTFSPWKLAWKRTTRNFEAAVVSTLPITTSVSALAVPNSKVMTISFLSAEEAHYVCGLLNNSLSRSLLNASITSEAHAEIIANVPIPTFDSSDSFHLEISEIARSCAESAAVEALDELREKETTLDELARRVWGVDKDELARARASLSQRTGARGRSR